MNLDAQNSTGVAEYDNEGNQVLGIDKIETYTNNIYGQRLTSFADNNADGKDDYKEYYTLNTYGGWVKKEIDTRGDGSVDKTEVYTKDANDRTLETVFYNGDIATAKEVYENDAHGRRIKLSRDNANDGSIDSTITYERDEWGRVVTEYRDNNNDGEIDQSITYIRDAYGYVTQTNTDIGNDGTVDSVRTYQRNALGQGVIEELDSNNDGTIDGHYEQTRDVYGRLVESHDSSYSLALGGLSAATINKYTFNEYGQRIQTESYNPARDTTEVTRFIYNELGQEVSRILNSGARWDFEYNDYGELISRTDYNAQGIMANKTVYTEFDYVHNGAVKVLETYNSTGTLTQVSEYIRNDAGQLIQTIMDYRNSTGVGVDILRFGDRASNSSIDVVDDLTKWSNEKLAKLGDGLSQITFSHGSVSNLTISAEIVAKITKGTLQVVTGRDNNDVLNLIGFEKSETSSRNGFDQYTAEVNGEHLDLFVSTTVDTHIIG